MTDECPVCGEQLDDASPSLHWCSPECQEVWQADDAMPVVGWFSFADHKPRDRPWLMLVAALVLAVAVALFLLIALGVSAWTLIA